MIMVAFRSIAANPGMGLRGEVLSDENWQAFSKQTDYDFSVTYPGIGRFRVALYRQRSSIAIALRPIMDDVPELTNLNLPE